MPNYTKIKFTSEQDLTQGEKNPKSFYMGKGFKNKIIFLDWDDQQFISREQFFYDQGSTITFEYLKAQLFDPHLESDENSHIRQHMVLYTKEVGIEDDTADHLIQNLTFQIGAIGDGIRFIQIHFDKDETPDYSEAKYRKYLEDKYGAGPIIPDTNNGGIIIKS